MDILISLMTSSNPFGSITRNIESFWLKACYNNLVITLTVAGQDSWLGLGRDECLENEVLAMG